MRDDDDLEQLVLAHSPRLQALLDTSRQQIREGKGISHEDFWKEVDEDKPGKECGKHRKSA